MKTIIFLLLFFNIQSYSIQENDKYIKFDISCEYDTWFMRNRIYFIDTLGNRQGVFNINSKRYENGYIQIPNEFKNLIIDNSLNIFIHVALGIADTSNDSLNGFYEGEKELRIHFENDSAVVNFEWKLNELKPVVFEHGDY